MLGLTYDAGPKSVAEFSQQWSQQTRLPLYEKLIQQLVDTGKVYACNCSRKLITKNTGNGLYQGTCRHKNISLNQPGVNWRIQVDDEAVIAFDDELLGTQLLQPAALMGDFVIRRRNGLPSYQIASLADDIHFGINFIVRGEDLLASTAAQLYLAKLIHATDFLTAQFTHHPLLKSDAGEKLSKTAGSGIVTHTILQSKDMQSVWQQIVQQLGKALPAKGISQVSDLLSR